MFLWSCLITHVKYWTKALKRFSSNTKSKVTLIGQTNVQCFFLVNMFVCFCGLE